jgi:hypothetical protein
MQIYIRRDNEKFGPYSREAVLEYVKQGVFKALDPACYAGMSEWKTVGELLGMNSTSKRTRGPEVPPSGKITAFSPGWPPPASGRPLPRAKGTRKRSFMIGLNVVLVMIVAAVTYIRLGGGASRAHRYLAAISGELARLTNQTSESNATPAPATPAPAIANKPVTAPQPAPATVPKAASTPAPTAAPTPAPTAAPTPAAAAAPTPAAAAASTPAPTPASTPAPPAPPKPFDPADLAGNPAAWPKTVRLTQAVAFPVIYESQVVGSVTAPLGSIVKLVNIEGDQLIVEYQGGAQRLSWKLTDLEQEVAQSGSAATPSAGTPAGIVQPPH